MTQFESKIFELSLFSLVIDHKLWLDYILRHIENYDTTCYTRISNFINIHELIIVGLKGGVAGSFHVVFENEVDGAADLLKLYLLLVDEAEVTRYIWFNGLDLHVYGCYKGGRFVSHKLS